MGHTRDRWGRRRWRRRWWRWGGIVRWDEAIGVAAPGGRSLRLREREGLGGEGRYLERDRPTDRVYPHHLEREMVKKEGKKEKMTRE